MVSRFYLIWLPNTYYPGSGIGLLTNPGPRVSSAPAVSREQSDLAKACGSSNVENHGSAYSNLEIAII